VLEHLHFIRSPTMFSYSESFSLVLEIIVSPRNGMSINRFEQSEVEREQIRRRFDREGKNEEKPSNQ